MTLEKALDEKLLVSPHGEARAEELLWQALELAPDPAARAQCGCHLAHLELRKQNPDLQKALRLLEAASEKTTVLGPCRTTG